MEVGKKQFSDNKKMVRVKKNNFFFQKEEVILVLTNVRQKCEGGRKNFIYLFLI